MILLFLLLSFAAFAEKNINIELRRPDKTLLRARLEIPDEKKPFGIILHLQGSACESVHKAYYNISVELKKKNWAHLLIEKPGVWKDMKAEDCEKDEYLLKNDIFQRANDAVHVLQFISKSTKWDQRYISIGKSEGTVVATLLAKKRYPVAMVLLAGANGLTMEEEFMVMLDKGDRPCKMTSKTEVEKKIDLVFTRPNSKEIWCGKPYYWWSRILRLSLMDDLKAFDFPIWVAHGTKDDQVPVEGSQAVEKLGKKNYTFRFFEGLNHKWQTEKGEKRWDQVMNDMDQWLLQF